MKWHVKERVDEGGDVDTGSRARRLHRGVHHRLLVAAVEEAQVRRIVGLLALEQRLAHPGDVAVAEDAPAPGEERTLDAVALGVLRLEEADGRLRDGEDGHAEATFPNGRRGSMA